MHTFSSVGYGSVAPVCAGAQVLVLIECYLALLIQAIVGAYVVFVFMRSRARVRFSKNVMITRVQELQERGDEEGEDEDESGSFGCGGGGGGGGLGGGLASGAARPSGGSEGRPSAGALKLVRVDELHFRLVRESFTQIRDARIYVQARYCLPELEQVSPETGKLLTPAASTATDCAAPVKPVGRQRRWSIKTLNTLQNSGCLVSAGAASDGSGNSNEGSFRKAGVERRAELVLVSEQMSTLDYWEVVHRITEASPLWPIRTMLATHLKSIDVSLTAYDPSFNQPVKLYTRYAKHEILHNCHFDPMVATADDDKSTVDHAKLDMYSPDEKTPERGAHTTRRGPAKSMMGSLRELSGHSRKARRMSEDKGSARSEKGSARDFGVLSRSGISFRGATRRSSEDEKPRTSTSGDNDSHSSSPAGSRKSSAERLSGILGYAGSSPMGTRKGSATERLSGILGWKPRTRRPSQESVGSNSNDSNDSGDNNSNYGSPVFRPTSPSLMRRTESDRRKSNNQEMPRRMSADHATSMPSASLARASRSVSTDLSDVALELPEPALSPSPDARKKFVALSTSTKASTPVHC